MDINSLIQKIEEKLRQINDIVNRVRDKINSLLSHVPGFLHWAVSKIQDLWNQFCAKMSEFWDWFTDKLAYAGDPFILQDTGDKWNTKLGGPAHKRAKEVDSDDLLVDDIWTGTGAEAYKSKIDGQKEALDSVGQNYATAVQSALNGMKTGIWVFWIGIVVALVILVAGVIIGAAADASIIGLPAGMAEMLAAVIEFLLVGGASIAALALLAHDSAASLRQVNSYYDDKWPSFALDS